MPRQLLIAVLLATAILNSGCGTVVNLVRPGKEEKAFGGVRFDVDQIGKLVEGEPVSDGPLATPGAGGGSVAAVVLLIGPFVDIPLSFIGDTLTYPLAWWLDRRR
ncbi:MAG TPA: hypothetical protein VKE74_26805 [Gemmataceae bacterium]|nr:hypothetical protein [Gemmataceae bacterium]